MSGDIDFGAHIGDAARILLGQPNAKLSKKDQLRFGTHGSVAVNIAGPNRGTWYDHESKVGGGLLDLINSGETRLANAEARRDGAIASTSTRPDPRARRCRCGRKSCMKIATIPLFPMRWACRASRSRSWAAS